MTILSVLLYGIFIGYVNGVKDFIYVGSSLILSDILLKKLIESTDYLLWIWLIIFEFF